MQQKTFDVTTLNGKNGFTVPGINQNGQLGWSVASAGDINGDGIDDIVLGAYYVNAETGAAYAIFGVRTGFTPLFNVTNLNGSNGFTLPGVIPGGRLGWSVASAGDINGDGINDLVLGAPYVNSAEGASYIVFGHRGVFASSFDLNSLNGTNGFIVRGLASDDNLGASVSIAGDLNGDGLSDLVIGVPNENGLKGAGYVIFGSRSGFSSFFNLTNLNGSNGFIIQGIASNSYFGFSVSIAGDLNGDGLSDLVLGAPFGTPSVSYVIFGNYSRFEAFFNVSRLNGNNGFVISSSLSSSLGISVSTAGDINADGITDLLLGDAYLGGPIGTGYVIFGSHAKFPAFFNLDNLNGMNGFGIPRIFNAELGYSISGLGDVSGDGIDDLVLGAPGTNITMTSAVYVIFGSRSGFSAVFNLNNLDGSNGFNISGSVGSCLGNSVSSAGDVNGDGINDILLGAPCTNANTGAAYVIFGKFQLVWIHNQLTITQGQTVPITLANINATAINNPAAMLSFTVSNVQGGRFEQVFMPNISLTNFTQQQIANGEIQFVSDRTAPVAYRINATDGQSILPTVPANVTFTNHPPQVLNSPSTHLLTIGEPFDFTIAANNTFVDVDGDPLTYSATLSDGSILPSWLHFDSAQSNQLHFNGTAPTTIEGATVSLLAADPLNASVSAPFQVVTVPVSGNNNGTASVAASTTQIAGGVVGGVLGLATAIAVGLGFWRYATNKTTRSTEQFADFIRSALNLKNVDSFTSETGQKFVAFVHKLQSDLKEAGIDISTLRPLELSKLADDVADAARNKISPASDCLGRSVITATDLNDNLKALVTEVQVLRNAGQERHYTV